MAKYSRSKGGYAIDDSDFSFADMFALAIDIQHIQWARLEEGETYCVELISPLRANTHKFKNTKYNNFVGVVKAESEKPRMHFGDIVIIEIPRRTFEKALWLVPSSVKTNLRPSMLKDNNLHMKFIKIKAHLMTIEELERRAIQDEHREYADKYYGDE